MLFRLCKCSNEAINRLAIIISVLPTPDHHFRRYSDNNNGVEKASIVVPREHIFNYYFWSAWFLSCVQGYFDSLRLGARAR